MAITSTKRRRKGSRKPINGTYVSSKTGATCVFRSGWEAKYMAWLDAEPTVTSWSYESFTIEYVSNRKGRVRKYIPDFLVMYADSRVQLVEIKPTNRLLRPTNVKKLAAARVWCSENNTELAIVTEVELKALGLFKVPTK